jgi:hypothetical protein
MIDSEAKLIGINVMINGPDVGMAVPAHVVQNFLRELDALQRAHEPHRAPSVMV